MPFCSGCDDLHDLRAELTQAMARLKQLQNSLPAGLQAEVLARIVEKLQRADPCLLGGASWPQHRPDCELDAL